MATSIGGSALLTESVPVADRVAVQGSADLLMSLCGALASFSSGFIREAWGYHVLAELGLLASGMLAVAAITTLRADRQSDDRQSNDPQSNDRNTRLAPVGAAGGG